MSSDSTAPLSPDHPLTHTSLTPTPTYASFHRRTAHMTMHAKPVMSLSHSARVTEAMALSDLGFCKMYRSSYETPSSSSSPALLVRKRYRGKSELILDTDSEEDEIGEEDTDEDKGHGLDDKGHGLDDEGRSVESNRLGLGYGALRRRELAVEEDQHIVRPEDGITYIDVPAYPPPAPPVQTPPSPKWSSASPVAVSTATIPVDEDQLIKIGAQLELYEGILHDHTYCLDEMPPTLFADIDRDVRELYTISGVVRYEIFSQRYRFRSLELEQERTVVMFGALWRPVLALDAWAGHVDTRMADMSRAGYDDHRLIHDMLV
ncbi:hypothetical protein Tco_0620183 [Tanacetum coccineum]